MPCVGWTADPKEQPYLTLEQGSPGWFAVRKGRLTASKIASLMGVGYESRRRFWELETGKAKPKVVTEAMMAGTRDEPVIRRIFARVLGPDFIVNPFVGSFYDKENGFTASPDGLVVDLASTTAPNTYLLEIKRPANALYAQPRANHIIQMHCQMVASGVNQCLYVVAHPDEGLRIWLLRFCPVIWAIVLDKVEEYREFAKEGDMPRTQTGGTALKAEIIGLAAAELLYNAEGALYSIFSR
jgi:hypothetical protein